ncbi:hypothetical protein CP10743SC13_0567 [Chlamydia psittaci 10_743_SC13]|nr:hypothetical protein CP10743SC13_0567 [Chlamydia psittaci 10_743_SC13]
MQIIVTAKKLDKNTELKKTQSNIDQQVPCCFSLESFREQSSRSSSQPYA